MFSKRSAALGLVAAAASGVLLASPATAQGAPTSAQVQNAAKVLSSGTSFGVAEKPNGVLFGHRRHRRRHHRRRHHRRHHWRHHRRHHSHHSNSNMNRNANVNTNINRISIENENENINIDD